MRRSPGRSYRFYTGTPLWPFGHSLSYTQWVLSWTNPIPKIMSAGALEQGVNLHVNLTNTGVREASKALLFFVAVKFRGGGSFQPPIKSLFAIAKVHLDAGESEVGGPGTGSRQNTYTHTHITPRHTHLTHAYTHYPKTHTHTHSHLVLNRINFPVPDRKCQL